MIDKKYKLIKNGVPISEITELEENFEKTIDHILEEFEYEPNDREGLSKSLREELYIQVIEFSERSEGDITEKFRSMKKDYEDAPNGHARSSISIIIGSRLTKRCDSQKVKKDILHISNSMLEKKYSTEDEEECLGS